MYDTLQWLQVQVSFLTIGIDNGRSMREGAERRQCTKNYKLAPMHKKVQELLGATPREALADVPWIEMRLGITMDEIAKVKTVRIWRIGHRYPLVDSLSMTRQEC